MKISPQAVNVSIAAVGGLLGGVFIGFQWAHNKLDKEYQASSESMRRAYEMALDRHAEAPAPSEDSLSDLADKIVETLEDRPVYDPVATEFTPATVSPYHTPVTPEDQPVTTSAPEVITNEQGVSYIEEEDFLEEDGRYKATITFVMDFTNPVFWLDGVQIGDWPERLGAHFPADFATHATGSEPAVLFVRNHVRDEDYEVQGTRQ